MLGRQSLATRRNVARRLPPDVVPSPLQRQNRPTAHDAASFADDSARFSREGMAARHPARSADYNGAFLGLCGVSRRALRDRVRR